MTYTDTAAARISLDALNRCGEHLAAGYMGRPDATPVIRFAAAVAEHLAHVDLPAYGAEALYPCGPSLYFSGAAAELHYSAGITYNEAALQAELADADEETRAALLAVREALADYPRFGGYTHSIPNYRRIITEGLESYSERIERTLEIAERRGEQDRVEFGHAMHTVLEAIRTLHGRVLAHLASAQVEGPQQEQMLERLIEALAQVPFSPARSFYEGIVAINFILYVDGPDDLGRFDQDLWPLYRADIASGALAREQALEWVEQVWENIDVTGAWNVALGGLLQDGTSAINDLTHVCVEAGTGRRRPNLALRLHRGAPDSIWDKALDSIAAGGGLPALYNEDAYIGAIREAHLGVSEADLPDFAFGGCTELMIHGKSNCGSLEGDINLPQVLVQSLDEHLAGTESFEEFLAAYKGDLVAHIRRLTQEWNRNQEGKSRFQPQVIRSLLIDDCIDNGREYNAGGARYNWCVVNVMGLANVIDSLAALRQVVFETGAATAEELLAALQADFVGHEALRRRLEACPRFGNAEPEADELARDISGFVFGELREHAPWRGGRYLPACLMFTTYAHFGRPVGATPDGRRAQEPIADSAGAMQGRDTSGPTALLQSVACIKHHLAPGTLVVNARFARTMLTSADMRRKLRDLIETYFELGGMQLQINVVDQAILRDAMEHPEQHGDLIIRVGGYSEYWTRLDDDLRRSILERVEHE